MNKRGQVYLLAAIIFAVALYGVSSIVNKVEQKEIRGDFEKLSENYETESARFINSLLGDETINKFESYSEFTMAFSSYVKAQDPSFGLIYAFSTPEDDIVQIGNFLEDDIWVKKENQAGDGQKVDGCYGLIDASISLGIFKFSSPQNINDISDCIGVIDLLSIHNPEIKIKIGEYWYDFEIDQGTPQIMIVSKLEQDEQRKVFIGGKGFKNGKR